MLMTEAQAEVAWCPMVRIGSNVVLNVSSPPVLRHVCIASGCMMWRWAEGSTANKPSPERRGYCGLAGKPGFGA